MSSDVTQEATLNGFVLMLGKFTDEQRLEIFSNFCKHCGRIQEPDNRCNCWNDE